MSDIVVTLPKTEYENFELELKRIKTGEYKVWSLYRTPLQLKEGDRIYVVKSGQVYASLKVAEIKLNHSIICSTTRREWAGRCQLFLNDYQEEELKIEVKPFPGFRYRWW